jgi:hypothetical protein
VANKNVPEYASDTAFQKSYNKSWKYVREDGSPASTDEIQVRTSTKERYRIETAFPIKQESDSRLK